MYKYQYSLEQRKQMSQSHLGKTDSIETKEKKRQAHLGKKNHFYGKHHTDEAKTQNRIKHMGRSVYQLDLRDNLIFKYDCIGDIKIYGYTEHAVRLVCKGEKNSYKGFKWMYKEDYEKYVHLGGDN